MMIVKLHTMVSVFPFSSNMHSQISTAYLKHSNSRTDRGKGVSYFLIFQRIFHFLYVYYKIYFMFLNIYFQFQSFTDLYHRSL